MWWFVLAVVVAIGSAIYWYRQSLLLVLLAQAVKLVSKQITAPSLGRLEVKETYAVVDVLHRNQVRTLHLPLGGSNTRYLAVYADGSSTEVTPPAGVPLLVTPEQLRAVKIVELGKDEPVKRKGPRYVE